MTVDYLLLWGKRIKINTLQEKGKEYILKEGIVILNDLQEYIIKDERIFRKSDGKELTMEELNKIIK